MSERDFGMTHRYTGPNVMYRGEDGIRKNTVVKIVGKARGGLYEVRAKSGKHYLVPRTQLVAL